MDNAFDPQPPTMRTIASICHCPGGPAGHEHQQRAASYASDNARDEQVRREKAEAELARVRAAATSSTTNYTIDRVERVGAHLVMQVRYPNCEHRAFEGLKTMVFLDVSELAALRWKSIDPHFRGPNKTQQAIAKGHAILLGVADREQTEAPSPAARFPGTPDGWADAVSYAKGKA